jgi:hypothetical protein
MSREFPEHAQRNASFMPLSAPLEMMEALTRCVALFRSRKHSKNHDKSALLGKTGNAALGSRPECGPGQAGEAEATARHVYGTPAIMHPSAGHFCYQHIFHVKTAGLTRFDRLETPLSASYHQAVVQ